MHDRSKKLSAMKALRLTRFFYKKYFTQILIVNLLSAVLSLLNTILSTYNSHSFFLPVILSAIISSIINTVFLWYINQHEAGHKIDFSAAFRQSSPRFIPVMLATIAVACISWGIGFMFYLIPFGGAIIGIPLLIFPGLVWWIMFNMTSLFVLLQKKRIGEALQASKALTKGHKWPIFSTYAQFYGPLFLISAVFSLVLNNVLLETYGLLVTVFLGSVPLLIAYAIWTLLHKNSTDRASV